MSIRLCPLLGLVLALASLQVRAADAPAQQPAVATPEAPAVLLAHKFREGDATTYRLVLDGKGSVTTGAPGLALPLSLAAEMTVDQKVLRVLLDGGGEVDTALVFKRIRLNEMDLPGTLPEPTRVVAVMTPSGRVTEVKAGGGGGARPIPGVDAAGLGTITQRLSFPDRPVKVGESWTEESAADAQYRATTTLLGIDRDNGREVARLKQVFATPIKAKSPNPLAGGSMTVDGKQATDLLIRFDVEAGRIADVTGTVDSAMTLGMGQGASMEMRLRASLRMDTVPPAPEATK